MGEVIQMDDGFVDVVAGYGADTLPMQSRADGIFGLIKTCHGIAKQSGWWRNPERDRTQLLMLCVSEIAEAMEGDRKNKKDDHLPHRPMREVELADVVIRLCDAAGGLDIVDDVIEAACLAGEFEASDGSGERPFYWHLYMLTNLLASYDDDNAEKGDFAELVGLGIISAFAIGKRFGLDMSGAIGEKLIYNSRREDHKPEVRDAEGGKAY